MKWSITGNRPVYILHRVGHMANSVRKESDIPSNGWKACPISHARSDNLQNWAFDLIWLDIRTIRMAGDRADHGDAWLLTPEASGASIAYTVP